MELILVKPVKKLGKIGSLVKVKNGFGRNWLIPQNLAIRATEQNKKLIEEQRHALEEKNAHAKTVAEALSKLLAQKDLTFIRQSADDGRLFGSVNNKEIANELSKICQTEISYSTISLSVPIKKTGVFVVEVILHPEVSTEIFVTIARSLSEAQESLRLYKSTNNGSEDLSEVVG